MDIKKFAYILTGDIALSKVSNIDFSTVNQNKIYIDFKENIKPNPIEECVNVSIIYFEVDDNKNINGKLLQCRKVGFVSRNRLMIHIIGNHTNDTINKLCKNLYEANNKKEV